jgi:hypothetical protein
MDKTDEDSKLREIVERIILREIETADAKSMREQCSRRCKSHGTKFTPADDWFVADARFAKVVGGPFKNEAMAAEAAQMMNDCTGRPVFYPYKPE